MKSAVSTLALDLALDEVFAELRRAVRESPSRPIYSHSHYGAVLNMVDALWDGVRLCDRKVTERAAVQVAAMALRFLLTDEQCSTLVWTDPARIRELEATIAQLEDALRHERRLSRRGIGR